MFYNFCLVNSTFMFWFRIIHLYLRRSIWWDLVGDGQSGILCHLNRYSGSLPAIYVYEIYIIKNKVFTQLSDDLIQTKRQSKSFQQNITFASEQWGRCLNPPIKSSIVNPLICTNQIIITLHMATNQQTLFNRLLIYAYKYYFKKIII